MKRSCCLWIALLCTSIPLLAEPFRVTAANLPDGPVRVSPFPAKAAAEEEPLSLRFLVTNASSEFVSRVELTAQVFSEDDQLRGFYSFTVDANLRPGEAKFFVQNTSTFSLSPGDVVELASEAASVGTGSWVRSAREDEGGGGLKALFESSGPADTCDARCAVKDEACTTKCVCGVLSFSCSCGVGTFTYTCSCQRCPT